MRKLLFLLPFLLLALPAAAQTNIQAGPVDPAKCDPNKGLLWFNNSTLPPVLKYCSAVNTWTAVGTATGSTIFPWTTLGFSATPALTVNNGSVNYFMPVTGNVTGVTTVGSAPNGTYLGINFQQDGTGGHTIPTSAFPGNFVFPTGCNFDLTANANNFFAWTFDGTNWQPVPGTCGKIVLQTNGTPNGSQSLLNLAAGAGASITDNGTGTVTLTTTAATQGTVGVVQKTDGSGNHVASNCTETSASQLNCVDDPHFRGPNLGVDVTSAPFNARPINQNVIPAPTATISASSNSATVSSASGFVKNDGIAIVGAGASQSMTTPTAPTVTPSCASSLTGTGYTVPAGAGSTAYAYSLVMRDQGGGYTAASTNGTTSTGNATLGANNTTASAYSISGTTVTATVTSSANLAAGCMINVTGTSDDPEFGGWFRVTSVPDGTHITYTVPSNSNNGMISTTATGGTIYFWLCNHITYAAATGGGTQYWIYGRTAGAMAFLKVSLLASIAPGTDSTYLAWDDFGSTMEASPVTPWWAPSSPPGSPVNDMLVTTITNIAGTTFTLANAATTSVTTSPARFDNAPAIQAAFNASYTFNDGGGGMINFPPAKEFTATPGLVCYVTSSYLVLGGALKQGSRICAGDTIEWDGGIWEGTSDSAIRIVTPSFGIQPTIAINSQGASPLIWYKGGNPSGGAFRKVTINDGGNEGVGIFVTETQAPHLFENVVFAGNDFMGVPFYYFSAPANGGLGGKFERCTFVGGTSSTPGISATPKFISKSNTFWNFDYISGDISGFYFTSGSFGGFELDFRFGEDWQGGNTPLITVNNPNGGAPGGFFAIHKVNLDTDGNPLIAQLSTNGTFAAPVLIEGTNNPSSNAPLISGIGFTQVVLENYAPQDYTKLGQNVGIVGLSNGANTGSTGIKVPAINQNALFYSANHTLNQTEGIVIATASGITFTLPHALRGQSWDIYNPTAGTITLTIDSGTLSGNGATGPITIAANTGWRASCDGTNCEAEGGGGGGGGGCAPGGSTDALQYNGGGTCSFGGVNSPTANGNYIVNYNVTASAAVAPTITIPGVPINPQTGTTYTYLYSDRGSVVTANNSGAQTYTLVNPSSAGFGSNYFNVMKPIGTGAVTENASGFTVNGGASLLVPPSWTRFLWSDGVNYTASRLPDFTAFPNCTGGGNALQFTTSTGVFSCGASSSGVASISGDGALISNSLSTGAVTLTLGTAGAHKVWMNNTGLTAAPGYQSIGEADLPATTVFTDKANTFGAFLNDFSASTVKIPTAAGFTAGATSMLGYDSTAKIAHIYFNNADADIMANTGTCTTTTNIVHATATAGLYSCGAMVSADIPSSAALAGSPTTTTQSAGDNSTKIATTAYVDTNACVPGSFASQTDGATVTWAIASKVCANASLTFTVHSGSRTLNITNPVNGGSYVLWIKQDATGGEGLTLGTGCTWKVSGGGGGAITPSTGANAIDVLAFTYDGTNCYANFNKNFN